MIRSHRLRLFCVSVLAAGAISLGWLVPAWWLATPAPRAVIPVGASHGLRFGSLGTAFVPSGSLFATVKYDKAFRGFAALGALGALGAAGPYAPSGGAPPVVQLWDSQSGKLRAELCKLKHGQVGNVEISSDGTRVRVLLTEYSQGLAVDPPPEKAKNSRRCWDLATATECDPDEPFVPFSIDPPELPEELEAAMTGGQCGCGPVECAPSAGAVVFLGQNNEIHLAFADERKSRKIADMPSGLYPRIAISPDAGQFVLNVPPRSSTGWPLLDRVRRWLDPRPEDADPGADEDRSSDTVNYVTDVASGRVLACWKTPHVASYKIFPDGRTLAVVSAEQTAFYDAPFRDPWLRRLAVGLAAGAVTFLAAWLVLTPGALSSRLRKLVPFSPALRKTPA
jgi:hypothetical protein